MEYDLEDRTFTFAYETRSFVKRLKKTIANIEDGKQVIKSSGSVGANYIEANKALRVRAKINSQILSIAAPGWQGAKAQAYQAYSELLQRRQAGCSRA